MRLVLASASPRRAELLQAAGFAFDVLSVDMDERVRTNEAPAEYVRRLASEKSGKAIEILKGPAEAGLHTSQGGSDVAAPDVAAPDVGSGFSRIGHLVHIASGLRRVDETIVLAADTAVVVDDQILGKPRDDHDARDMLRRLAGRSHQVMTGVSLRCDDKVELRGFQTTQVWFASLTQHDIDWYVSTREGRDKAGAYAIQGLASRFIPRIDGSYSNVVGLPVALVHGLLNQILESGNRVIG